MKRFTVSIQGHDRPVMRALDQAVRLELRASGFFDCLAWASTRDGDYGYYEWTLPRLNVGDRITIELFDDEDVDPASKVEESLRKNTERLREVVEKLKVAPSADGDALEDPPLACSFCGKSQHEVSKLMAGPGAMICIECIVVAGEVFLAKEDA